MNLITTTIQPTEGSVHVYPMEDSFPHDTEHGVDCPCNPTIKAPEPDDEFPVIIHNAFDGRE